VFLGVPGLVTQPVVLAGLRRAGWLGKGYHNF
jgi:hypothetical protein